MLYQLSYARGRVHGTADPGRRQSPANEKSK